MFVIKSEKIGGSGSHDVAAEHDREKSTGSLLNRTNIYKRPQKYCNEEKINSPAPNQTRDLFLSFQRTTNAMEE